MSIILPAVIDCAQRYAGAGGCREATTLQALACKEKRQGQAPENACR
jgi:hypothetical protein